MSYAVPASGILCLELLRQAHSRNYALRLSRSEIIQDLSVLVAFLDWIQHWAASGEMVSLIRKILGRCLDRILEVPPSLDAQMPQNETFLDMHANRASITTSDFPLELMNTFDWINWDDCTTDTVHDTMGA